jgi:hypothetical protein
MKIQLENYELLYSGSIILIDDLPLQMTLSDEIEGDLVIIFKFKKDASVNGSITRLTPIDTLHLDIEFINFIGSEEIGNTKLMELGTLRKIPLFLNYRINVLKGVSRTVLLNFYLRKEV